MQKASTISCLIILVLLLSTFTTFFNFDNNGRNNNNHHHYSTTAAPAAAFAQEQQQQKKKGPYIDQVTFIHREDQNLALEEIKSKNLDEYYFQIPLEAAGDAANDPRITLYDRMAGSVGLLLNPAPAKDGSSINPFQLRQVRFAMNYLIDRQFVVNEILKGYGSPLIDPFGAYSPEYLNIVDTVESFGFTYNPGLAKKMIHDAMTAAGATEDATTGKWLYKGNPVTIKIMIRLDDAERKSIGELVASKLEDAGFTVQRDFGDLTKANTIVYGSNPQDFRWQVYTEGLAGTSVFVKYNPTIPAQMYAPWMGSMPGSENPSFWNYQNATLDDLTERINFANFTSAEERTKLVNAAVKEGIQESVRIFLAQRTEPFAASSSLKGLVNDFGAGITSKYSLLNVRPPDGRNSLNIGVKQIHQGSWNTIAGLSDTYSRDIYSALSDSATFRDPYTGEVIPMRAQWTDISTEGPTGKLKVEQDAQVWNPATQSWKDVGSNATATSKVVYKLLYSKWHNGIMMDKSDLLFSEYFTFEWGTPAGPGNPEKKTVDPEYTSVASQTIPRLKGIKFQDEDTLESYVDYWHYDKKEIADFAPVWPSEPWEINAATERLVTQGKLAYSRSQAIAKNVDWIDPIIPEHALMIRDELQKMKDEGYIPVALKGIVSTQEAKNRYDASIAWINAHKNAVIGNGAYYLDNFNIAGGTITIKAFRDPSYPFEVGHWSAYDKPKLASIEKVDASQIIDIGKPVEMSTDIKVDGKPSNDAIVDYFIFNKEGHVVIKGEANPVTSPSTNSSSAHSGTEENTTGVFRIDLPSNDTSKLSIGPNQLRIFANSKLAFRPDISTTTIIAIEGSSPSSSASNNATSSSNSITTTEKGQTSGLAANDGGNGNGGQSQQQLQQQQQQKPSGCLIATAAFGSELTPQVQFLRNFREQYILSTTSGSAFMDAFNTIYYSFSPQVADYERQQPWLQAVVKTGIYPLFGILMTSEKAYSSADGGETGALASGAVASTLIGAIYLWPAALSSRLQRRFEPAIKISIATMIGSIALIVLGIMTSTRGNDLLLSVSTSLFVLSTASTSAIMAGKLVRSAYNKISHKAEKEQKR